MSSRDWWGRAEQRTPRPTRKAGQERTSMAARPSGRALPIPRNLCSLRTIMFPKYCTSISILVLVFSLDAMGLAADTPRSDRHVVVVVWDGMRPDFVSEKTTPTLWKLAREGVTFRNHHAVYPSATHGKRYGTGDRCLSRSRTA